MESRWCSKRAVHGLLAGISGKLPWKRRSEPLWVRLGATGLALFLAVYGFMVASASFGHSRAGASNMTEAAIVPPILTLAASPSTAVAEPAAALEHIAKPSPLEAGKVLTTQDALPHLAIVSAADPNTQIQYDLTADSRIILNGTVVKLTELKPGDSVKVTASKDGVATIVEATRSKTGIVTHVGADDVTLTTDYVDVIPVQLASAAAISLNGKPTQLHDLQVGDSANVVPDQSGKAVRLDVTRQPLFEQFWDNFRKNLFKPLLLFFYMGFLIPILKIAFEFPRAVYQGLTIYLLISIGWHGGEELAVLSGKVLDQALGFIVVGFLCNLAIGFAAYFILRTFIPKLRKIDSATIAAYYGSDSAGTFVTCVGVLQAAHIAYAAYMPVMLAVMEIPGCLVGLYIVSRLRKSGMDSQGNMPGERGFDRKALHAKRQQMLESTASINQTAASAVSATTTAPTANATMEKPSESSNLESKPFKESHPSGLHLVREVLLNPGLFLLFGGIIIGYISRTQGVKVVEPDDKLFVTLFQGLLCLFLLEMGMTASRHLKDLTTASWRYVAFGILGPNVFAIFGMCMAMIFSHAIHMPFQLGSYVLFAVLCGAASYIAVPAIQRIAIPEASPTLPLAASLGLTFSYNVTIGIPVYLVIAQHLLTAFPMSGV